MAGGMFACAVAANKACAGAVHCIDIASKPCLATRLAPLLLPFAASEDIGRMPYLRMTIAESMRLYPQPPILIRRCVRPLWAVWDVKVYPVELQRKH